MKKLNLVFFIPVFFLLSSCQKELYFDAINSSGSLQSDSTGDCFPSFVNGQYMVDSILNTDHFIDVSVNVRVTGPYIIQSDTINGYSFAAQGNFTSLGLTTVRLLATGRPLDYGLNQFTISYGKSICIIDINVQPASAYELINCNAITVSGSYVQGTAITTANTAMISVNVTSLGNYAISTYKNGVTFFASGVFTATGIQNVALSASGAGISAGIFDFTVTTPGGSSCNFAVTFYPMATVEAIYTVGGAGGRCSGVVLNGTYTAGVPMNASNFITIEVVVSSVGAYTMNTGIANGVSFSTTGIFTTNGLQTVNLAANGTALSPEAYDYGFVTPNGACGYIVEFLPDFLSASFDGSLVETFNNNLSAVLNVSAGISTLVIMGNAFVTGNENLKIELETQGAIIPGYYNINQAASGTVTTFSYTDDNGIVWSNTSNISTNQQPISQININSITTGAGGRVRGLINVFLKENGIGPATKNIYYGNFNLELQ